MKALSLRRTMVRDGECGLGVERIGRLKFATVTPSTTVLESGDDGTNVLLLPFHAASLQGLATVRATSLVGR